MRNLGLLYGDLLLSVSAAKDDLQWLRESLEPSFDVIAEEADSVPRVTLTRRDETFEECSKHPSRGAAIGFFALDSGLAMVEERRVSEREWRLFFDPRLEVFYRVDRSGLDVEIVARVDTPRARVAALRVLREFVMGDARTRGRSIIHAAAIATDGGVILVAGPKASGKTTTLLSCLSLGVGTFVANDRVSLSRSASGFFARGLPTLVSLQAGLMIFFPTLSERLEEEKYSYRKTLEEHARNRLKGRPSGPPWDLSPAQFLAAVGIGATAGGPATCVLFLSPESRGRNAYWRRLKEEEATARLAENLCAGGRVSEILRSPDGIESCPDSLVVCSEVARSVPAFEVVAPELRPGRDDATRWARELASRMARLSRRTA